MSNLILVLSSLEIFKCTALTITRAPTISLDGSWFAMTIPLTKLADMPMMITKKTSWRARAIKKVALIGAAP